MVGGMEQMPHILVVDDDREIRDLLARFLERHRMRVTAVRDAREARRAWPNGHFHLVVLDLMLPGESGLDLARWMRTQANVPLVMLTAMGEETDRIIGLELGADDYVAKPFNPRELLARVQAVLRRRRTIPSAAPEQREPFSFGRFRLDFQSRTLHQDETPLTLSGSEFALLKIFVNHPMRTLTRERLLELLHGPEYDGTDRGIDVQVWRLRRILETDPSTPRFIQTVRGRGYVFVPDGEQNASAH
jgi:two-component system phosphate regulon response regulator OmpR